MVGHRGFLHCYALKDKNQLGVTGLKPDVGEMGQGKGYEAPSPHPAEDKKIQIIIYTLEAVKPARLHSEIAHSLWNHTAKSRYRSVRKCFRGGVHTVF